MSFIVPLCARREAVSCGAVPCDEEEHYDDYVMTLYAQGVLTPKRLIWGLSSLSPKKVLGASLWQRYTRALTAVQSGAENAAAGSLLAGISQPTSAGER